MPCQSWVHLKTEEAAAGFALRPKSVRLGALQASATVVGIAGARPTVGDGAILARLRNHDQPR